MVYIRGHGLSVDAEAVRDVREEQLESRSIVLVSTRDGQDSYECYCSNNDGDDCTTDRSVVRSTFEPLFDQYGVDLVLEAHEHSYERLYPVYDTHVTQRDYSSPLAPTHIVTGTAGCNEQAGACINPIPGPRGDWSAFHSANRLMYGYGHLQAVNATHLSWDELLVEENGQRLDAIWLVQQQHGNFSRQRQQSQHAKQQASTTSSSSSSSSSTTAIA